MGEYKTTIKWGDYIINNTSETSINVIEKLSKRVDEIEKSQRKREKRWKNKRLDKLNL